jgi:hypothetical protein
VKRPALRRQLALLLDQQLGREAAVDPLVHLPPDRGDLPLLGLELLQLRPDCLDVAESIDRHGTSIGM